MIEEIKKNVRQIGEIENTKKVYIEDYVYTYLQHLTADNIDTTKTAILLGRTEIVEDKKYIIIQYSLEIRNLIDTDGKFGFDEDCFNEAYQTRIKYFEDCDILGWCILVPGFELMMTSEVAKIHNINFPGNDKLIMMIEPIEKDEVFFIYENGIFRKLNGFYIYYDKNEKMQEYMINLHKNEKKEIETDEVTKNIRSLLSEKKNENNQKKMVAMLSFASTFLLMIVMIIGITLINNYDKMRSLESSIKTISNSIVKEEETSVAEEVTVENIVANEPESEEKSSETINETVPVISNNVVEQTPQYYTVQEGDTIIEICRKIYNSTDKVKEICELNKISDFNYIYVGQVLRLP